MNISTYTCILTIVLSVLQVNSSCPAGSKELDDQCSTYCYQVVKPLLQYVNTIKSMTQEHNEMQNTIKLQAETIKNLNELINFKEMQKTEAIKNLNDFKMHKAETIKNLNDLIKSKDLQLAQQIKLSESCESHNRDQQKLIDQYEEQLSKLKSEVMSRDNKIKDLRSENVKTKDLQNEIKACKQRSSCLGKSTDLHVITVGAQRMTVPCDSNVSKAGAGWTVILRRNRGSVNFNRTWSEYKEGFGDLRGEFFLGLEKLHLLTQSQPHELYISLMDFANATRYGRYSKFVIGNETELYGWKEMGIYSGNADDPIKYHPIIICAKRYYSDDLLNECKDCYLRGWYVDHSSSLCVDFPWFKFVQIMIRPLSN